MEHPPSALIRSSIPASPKSGAYPGRLETCSVIADAHHHLVLASFHADLDTAGATMADGVAETFLDDAIHRFIERAIDVVLRQANVEGDFRRACPRQKVTRFSTAWRKPTSMSTAGRRRPSIARMCLCICSVASRIASVRASISPRAPPLPPSANDRGIDADRAEERPDLVMQVPREIGAFLLLDRGQLFLEPEVAGLHLAEPVQHAVESAAQARQFERAVLRRRAGRNPRPRPV